VFSIQCTNEMMYGGKGKRRVTCGDIMGVFVSFTCSVLLIPKDGFDCTNMCT
jgi:hypothetical protein